MPRYVINARTDRHHEEQAWSVWELVPSDEPVLLGEYDSLASAKASLNVRWIQPDSPAEASWHYIGELIEDENDGEVYEPEGPAVQGQR